MDRAAWVFLAMFLLAGCGGKGGSGSSIPAPAGMSGPASATFTLAIPARGAKSTQRHASYVSPATSSVTVAVDAGAPQAFNASGATITVSINGLTPGSHTFAIDEFAGMNGTGFHLATATATQTLVAGGNTLAVTAKGIAATATIALNLQDGIAASIPISLVALDASGSTITGTYSTNFTISGGSAHATISGLIGSDSQTATMSYDGTCFGASFMVTATDGTVNASYTVGSTFHMVTTTADSGAGSLRAALTTQADGDSEVIATTGTVTLASSLPAIAHHIAICSTGGALTLDGGSSQHIMTVSTGGTLALSSVNFAHALASSAPGGALAVNAGTATISGASFNNNSGSGQDGSAMYVAGGATASVTNSSFVANSSGGTNQGALRNDGTVSVNGSAFTNNSATGGGSGAAVYANGGNATFTNTTFDGNVASGSGGSAGAIYGNFMSNASVTLSGCTFGGSTANTANANAGVIRMDSGTLNVSRTTFLNGTVTGGASVGGALLLNVGTQTTIDQSYFASNSTGSGGAIYSSYSSTVTTIRNSTFYANTGSSSGGGVFVNSGTVNLLFDTFSANTGASGAAVFQNGGTLNSTGTIFANSTAAATDFAGTIASGDYNYFTNATGATIAGTHNLFATSLNLGSPVLNGGATKNLAPTAGDSVIGVVPAATLCLIAVDQRGMVRPHTVANFCTIGSVEP